MNKFLVLGCESPKVLPGDYTHSVALDFCRNGFYKDFPGDANFSQKNSSIFNSRFSARREKLSPPLRQRKIRKSNFDIRESVEDRSPNTFILFERGALLECVPLIEILKRKKLISDVDYEKARDQLDHLGRMLTKLVQAHE